MPQYVFAYRAPKDYVPSGEPETVAAWMGWFDQLGSSVTDMGKPVFTTTSVGTCDDSTRLGGYSLVTAPDLESAVTLAKGSPALAAGGGVEVGELADVG